MSLAREREVALVGAWRAAEAILAIYADGVDVAFKDQAGDDPVTNADRASNAILVEALADAFPADAIVAEESDVPAGFGEGRRCWFVDPLDGTKEFVARVGEFCVMVGLAIDGRAALGVVVVPALPLRTGSPSGFALVGDASGAFVIDHAGTSHPIAAHEPVDPARPRLVVSRSRRSPRLDAIFGAIGAPREIPCGSVGVKLAKVLLDEADGYVHPASQGAGPKLWDLCAPHAIAEAAGLAFTDERGAPISYAGPDVAHEGGMVVAGRTFHASLLDAIARV